MNCDICNGHTVEHSRAIVRSSCETILLKCVECGFVFIPEPSWLDEAYAEPIDRSDTGYVSRNLWAREKARDIIDSHLNPDGMFLDYAAGYGLFVRLMRDAGYDFRWSDLHCQNLFSRGFEAANPLIESFEAVTAFEVFEHLTNPIEEMKKLSAITDTLIFSTTLIPEPPPQPDDWWYYGLEHGQHIAFYTAKSLELLGDRSGYHFATDNSDLHVFSRRQIPNDFFSRVIRTVPPRWKFWVSRNTPERTSLTMPDHDFIVKQKENSGTNKLVPE